MKPILSSLSFLGIFLLGVLISANFDLPTWMLHPDLSHWALYALMFLVGITVGSDTKTLQTIRHLSPRMLMLPLATIIGTALGVTLIHLIVPAITLKDAQAVGAGYGYYSLSSLIITENYSATIGAIALLSNILRELIAIIFAPLFARLAGNVAPICAAGATSMDTTLPFIVAATKPHYAIISIYHGVILTILTPVAVSLALTL